MAETTIQRLSKVAEHGAYQRYRQGCRCAPCTAAHRVYMRAYTQRRRAEGRLPEQRDPKRVHFADTEGPTPIQSCSCSLSGWDPPWMWSWARCTPFSEMYQIPCGVAYAGWDDRLWRERVVDWAESESS